MCRAISIARQADWIRRFVLSLTFVYACVLSVCSAADVNERLDNRLKPLIEAHKGTVAVMAKDLSSGQTWSYQPHVIMPTASLIKLPIMVETYWQADAGTVDVNDLVSWEEEDKVPGSGILTKHFSTQSKLSLRDLVRLMIAYSDNTATNLVIDQIGLPATSRRMELLGLANTKLHSKVFRRNTSIAPQRSRKYGLGSTSAAEIVGLLERIGRRELVSEAACEAMLEHLRACQDGTKIARFLPPQVQLAHKTGAVSGSRCDAGLIEHAGGAIALCILTTDNEDRRWTDDNAAEILCGRVARIIFDQFSPNASAKTGETSEAVQRQFLATGAQGELVEALQRTLNHRLHPSPDLSIDGDFGPQTEQAVLDFQRQQQLPVSGHVDQATWTALSPLVEAEEAVADPQTVNEQAKRLPKQPADNLDGPPFVTCKAWAAADAITGELIAESEGNASLHPASTTKIMTALVVLEQVKKHPELLNEKVVFSRTADETVGSTSSLRAGEIATVRQLLYGLLLPSGNDAAVALAETVGKHLDEPAEAPPYERFVAEMNATAKRLGMSQSSYSNPHGLTNQQHKTSAIDLATLAFHARKHPLFREITTTRMHAVTVDSQAGYRRNVLWKNTNQLLAIEGFAGVKTGTTRAAGACLVSVVELEPRSMIVTVLGSTGTEARYTDTRNLVRWLRTAAPERLLSRVSETALELHYDSLVFDGHNDLPWQFRERGMPSFEQLDISKSVPGMHTDIPRLRKGGVNAQYWSVYVPVDKALTGEALLLTLEQIDLVKAMIEKYPETFALAETADDVQRIRKAGKIASLIGVEGGHCIEGSLNVLRQLYQQGARYMTLTHSSTLDWADSATDEPRHGGLSAFGEEVVREMNRLGMLVDLSHVSVETMKDALRVSQAPVIFSHSSARRLADHPRNVPDDVLKLTAENGGVVMINFYSSYIVAESAQRRVERDKYRAELEADGLAENEVNQRLARWDARNPLDEGELSDVVDHIEHVIRVAGIDHVGLGSDYDGVDALPRGLEDVSTYPRITQQLLDRGYSEQDIRKVLGQNALRVLRQAEQVAKSLRQE